MEGFDKTHFSIPQNQSLNSQSRNSSSKVIAFSSVKEKKKEVELKQALNNVLAKARELDW
ncbi:hypothetical protein [Metapseudomonas otitidis]|uniref:hypothetical protein n=1 Tax=Metapseudomonas otitidis TaxID=319939 RepID=UPI00244ACEE2|nr:hypothetical protein [Pseudomonas otitidis]MDG9782100.1 hypothetical protein [Pseudomonas otitidis]